MSSTIEVKFEFGFISLPKFTRVLVGWFCLIKANAEFNLFFFTLEYKINVQQILFQFWILAQIHTYFVLDNSKENMSRYNFVFLLHIYYLLMYTFIWSTYLFGTLKCMEKFLQIYLIFSRNL